jgi:hypothetical protein
MKYHTSAKKFVLNSLDTWYVVNRVCTVTTVTHFSHCGMHPSVEEMGVWCLKSGGDSLLHISVCHKLLAS